MNTLTTHHPIALTPPCDECGHPVAHHITRGATHHDVLQLCSVCMATLTAKRRSRVVCERSYA